MTSEPATGRSGDRGYVSPKSVSLSGDFILSNSDIVYIFLILSLFSLILKLMLFEVYIHCGP